MKINWNFLGGGLARGDAKQKTFHGGSMDIFWNCTIIKANIYKNCKEFKLLVKENRK